MATNKKHEFATEIVKLADFAKILSHPARMTIIQELSSKESCICGEIVDILPLAQSTVSQHIKEIMNAGIIQGTFDGTKSCYCLNTELFKELSSTLNEFLGEINITTQNLNCC